jgi:hypothetical protein
MHRCPLPAVVIEAESVACGFYWVGIGNAVGGFCILSERVWLSCLKQLFFYLTHIST